jgi:mRNA deadenylase 3'-5' endonuclease subunit Ccr4
MIAFFSLIILFFITNLFGMENVQEPFKLKVMTYNLCNFWGMANKPETAHLTWKKRKDRIFQLILDEKPDIIGLQEIRDDNGKSTIKGLWKGLSDHGYEIMYQKHNPSPGAYINVIVYNSKKLVLGAQSNWWLSDTPKVYSDFENGWGNAVLMASLYPIVIKKGQNYNMPSHDYSCPIHVVNVHNSLKHELKLKTNKILVDQITLHTKRIDAETKAGNGIIIITGDFNTIPSHDIEKELAILKNDGYQEILNDLKTKDGVSISGTFIGYSSDKYQCPKGELSGQLDHIFLKTYPGVLYTSQSYVNLKRYNGNDNSNATTQAELLEGLDGKENRDEFPSDHIPGIVELELVLT